MSYILDALKRAERERKQGKMSVLDEIPVPAAPVRRRWPHAGWFALGAPGVVVLVSAYLLWPAGQPKPVPAPIQKGPSPPVASPMQATQPRLLAPPPETAAKPPPSATIEDGGRIVTLDDVYGKPTPPPAGEAAEAAPTPRGEEPEPRAPRVHRGVETPRPSRAPPVVTIPSPDAAADTVAQGGDEPAATPAETPAETAPAGAEGAPPPATAAAPPPPAAEQALREMPESYRSGFPSLSIDVHAYNADPKRRFVLIAGKRYRENDVLSEGPRIVTIVPEGIVFDWKGQQVLYPVRR